MANGATPEPVEVGWFAFGCKGKKWGQKGLELNFVEVNKDLEFANALDGAGPRADNDNVLGAYWFRPAKCARGGMPRTVRWPRKKSNQK